MDRKTFFGSIAKVWDKEHQVQEQEKRLEKLFGYFSLAKGDRVLDVGCGTGRLVPLIKRAIGDQGLLVESDFSREMLEIGKAKFFCSNVSFVLFDAEMAAIKTNVFDVVVCFALFPHLVHKEKALREFRRILKPGKKLIIAHTMAREELNKFHSRVNGPVCRDYLPDEQEMKRLFSLTGFRRLVITDKPSFYVATAWV